MREYPTEQDSTAKLRVVPHLGKDKRQSEWSGDWPLCVGRSADDVTQSAAVLFSVTLVLNVAALTARCISEQRSNDGAVTEPIDERVFRPV